VFANAICVYIEYGWLFLNVYSCIMQSNKVTHRSMQSSVESPWANLENLEFELFHIVVLGTKLWLIKDCQTRVVVCAQVMVEIGPLQKEILHVVKSGK
jgi:hypothetical protein